MSRNECSVTVLSSCECLKNQTTEVTSLDGDVVLQSMLIICVQAEHLIMHIYNAKSDLGVSLSVETVVVQFLVCKIATQFSYDNVTL